MESADVRFCAVGRVSDRCVIAQYCHAGDKKKFGGIVSKVFRSDKVLEHGRMQIPNKDAGMIHVSTSEPFVYTVITREDYPLTTASQFLRDLKEYVDKQDNNTLMHVPEDGLSKSMNQMMVNACKKYDGMATVGKVQEEINGVKAVMYDNIDKILATQEKTGELAHKTEQMQATSSQFKQQSRTLAKMMFWRKVKLYAILGLMGGAVVGYVILGVVGPALE